MGEERANKALKFVQNDMYAQAFHRLVIDLIELALNPKDKRWEHIHGSDSSMLLYHAEAIGQRAKNK